MNFLQLYYFTVVAEEQNVSHAAQKLYISQQSLSNHIKHLEEELQVKLFERTPRLSLTYAGQCTLRTAREILKLQKQLYDTIDDIKDEKIGSLIIGTTHVRARTYLTEIIPSFLNIYPQVQLETVADRRMKVWEMLLQEKLDLIILNQPPENAFVERVPLIEDPFCVVIPHNLMVRHFPDNYKQLLDYWNHGGEFHADLLTGVPVIIPKGTTISEKAHLYLGRNQMSPHIAMQINDVESTFRLCQKGVGITFSYERYANTMIRNYSDSEMPIHIIPIPDPDMIGNVMLCFLKNRYQTKLMRSFIQIAKDTMSRKSE